MTWNHRVFEARLPDGENWYTVHEVHYDEAGKPVMYSDPMPATGESMTELIECLGRMQVACAKPVLRAEDFGSEVQE